MQKEEKIKNGPEECVCVWNVKFGYAQRCNININMSLKRAHTLKLKSHLTICENFAHARKYTTVQFIECVQ